VWHCLPLCPSNNSGEGGFRCQSSELPAIKSMVPLHRTISRTHPWAHERRDHHYRITGSHSHRPRALRHRPGGVAPAVPLALPDGLRQGMAQPQLRGGRVTATPRQPHQYIRQSCHICVCVCRGIVQSKVSSLWLYWKCSTSHQSSSHCLQRKSSTHNKIYFQPK
jgi:hypothetical protein